MHQTRETIPKEWPLTRKGRKYVVVSRQRNGIPLLVVLRDMLKLGRTRKEIKKILNEGNVAINGKTRKDERFSLLVFDIITIKKINKNYRIILSKRKFQAEEIKEKDAAKRICRINGKKAIGKNKFQLNLDNGENILYNGKAKTGESVVIDLNEKKIIRVLPVQKSARVFVSVGKHKGGEGIIKDIKDKTAIIEIGEKDVEIQKKDLTVIE
ncbi:hypothetical protein HYT26_04125 [Candidatus Pacearchaeota archaeon]|nr:hypothetical protein [Candidatus Pacearchaeota archaeon]